MSSTEFLYALLRLQFGLSASFHFLFVPLSIGLLLCICILQTCHVRTGQARFMRAARFWRRFFLLAWFTGVCTGYPMRWQLQENWANYAQAASPILAQIFSIEGAIGPLMLTGVALTMFGRRLMGNRLHMVAGWVLMILLMAQAFTILAVNAWMQHPVGVAFEPGGWRLQSLAAIVLSETALHKVWHTLSGAMLAGAMFVMALSASMLIRQRFVDVAGVSMRVGAWVGMMGVASVLLSGHDSAAGVAQVQPMKFAAFEAHWQRDEGASPLVLFALPDEAHGINRHELHVPYLLSLMSSGTLASPPGILDLTHQYEQQLAHALMSPDDPRQAGLLRLYNAAAERYQTDWPTWTREERIAHAALAARPPIAPVFWAFRVMVASGLLLLALCTLAFVKRDELAKGGAPWLLTLIRVGAPLPWVAIISGWAVAEMGRQPWTVNGQLPTFHAMLMPSLEHAVLNVFEMFVAGLLISVLFAMAWRAAYRAGPDHLRQLDLRHVQPRPALLSEPAAVWHEDQRRAA